jgi:hypothetical protein
MPIMNAMFRPDASGEVFESTLEQELALATAVFGVTPAWVMQAPTGSDIGFYGAFKIPQNYVGTPKLVIRGVLEGNTGTKGFGLQQTGGIADNEPIDVAYEAEDVSSGVTTGHAAEDMYEEIITITPTSAYVVDDTVFFFFFLDDSVDTQTTEFYLTGLFFRYDDV